MSCALVIDDEPDIRELLAITLERMSVESECVETLAAAKVALGRREFDICLTDMRLPDGNGIDFVSYAQERHPRMPIAVITAHGNMESAIQALKAGAFDFLTKPVDLALLRTLVNSALKLSADITPPKHRLVGDSEAMRKIRQSVEKLARSQAPIYISGESGTGKELVARMIHEQGPRAAKAFVPVNCGAIPPDLMESEFFGHRKGSFTGAVSDKEGLFQAAEGGTLFFDEIAELPLHMQVKLLRAIQEKSVRRVGSNTENPVNVRILSATHKDLAKLTDEGKFRQDLFYRINVIELPIPPLRERPDDIGQLIDFMLDRMAASLSGKKPIMSDSALQRLQAYPFPGNIRELENILERAVTLCEGNRIGPEDLQLPDNRNISSNDTPAALDSYLDDVEKQSIIDALEKTRWNKTAAARKLGISLRALRYRLEKLGID